MKENKLIWMMKEVQQMQKVLMVMIHRIETIEKEMFEDKEVTEEKEK
jgi:hypothetical protein|tara:strand:+ start:11 stop:151 length:141 start_codon:yes stop_codon:yes gene_type:complete